MPSTVSRDHAADAAKLLRRLAIFIAFVVTPTVALLSRTAATIALPVTAVLLAFATLVDPDRATLPPRIRRGLGSPLVLALLYFAAWLAITLAWTPFPAISVGRLAETLVIAAVATAGLLALPEKMRASTLNLIPIGAFIAALALAGLAILAVVDGGPAWLRPERLVFERGIAALCLFAFIGAGWLISRGRRIDAVALLLAVAAAFVLQGGFMAGAVFGGALAVFMLGWVAPRVTAALVMLMALATFVVVPALPLVAETVGFDWAARWPRDIEAVRALANRVANDWMRYIGGHGFDSMRFAQRAAIMPRDPLRAPHLDLWFEAGIPAVLAAFAAIALAARWAMRWPPGVAAATLAILTAGLIYAVIGSPATPRGYGLAQNWWLSTVALAAIGLASIARGQFRTRRPQMKEGRALPAAG